MATKNCIILVSCKTQQSAYTRSVSSQPDAEQFWTGLLNTVVKITDPANFPDIYYTVTDVCFSNDPAPGVQCLECFDNSNPNFPLGLEYVIPTETDQCPSDAFVLVNCNADPSVFTQAMSPDEIIQSPETALVTSTDLLLYVGGTVNIEEYPGNCYNVLGPYTSETGCPCPQYNVTNAFKDCSNCCTPPVQVPWIRSVQEPVRDHTIVTISDCDIQTNKKFAENYYKLFKGLKYGMENCCKGIDYDKLWIEKELSDYSMLKNPDLC